MSKIERIIEQTKCGVYLSINPHRDYYESPLSYMVGKLEQVSDDLLIEMEKSNTLISLTIYPDTPIGSLDFYGVTIDSVLDEALEYYDNR